MAGSIMVMLLTVNQEDVGSIPTSPATNLLEIGGEVFMKDLCERLGRVDVQVKCAMNMSMDGKWERAREHLAKALLEIQTLEKLLNGLSVEEKT